MIIVLKIPNNVMPHHINDFAKKLNNGTPLFACDIVEGASVENQLGISISYVGHDTKSITAKFKIHASKESIVRGLIESEYGVLISWDGFYRHGAFDLENIYICPRASLPAEMSPMELFMWEVKKLERLSLANE